MTAYDKQKLLTAGTADHQAELISPASVHAERSVLAGLIECPQLMDEAVACGLVADDFSLEDYRRVFTSTFALQKSGSAVDYILVAEHLGGRQDDYALVGSLLDGAVIERDHTLDHVAIVRKKSKLRQLEKLGEAIAAYACDPSADPNKIAERIRERLTEINTGGVSI